MLRAMEDKMDKDIGDLELNKQEQNRQRVTGRISEVPGLNLFNSLAILVDVIS